LPFGWIAAALLDDGHAERLPLIGALVNMMRAAEQIRLRATGLKIAYRPQRDLLAI